jgi:hypothetical protein
VQTLIHPNAWKVTMLTILIIVLLVLLLTGGIGFRRHGRRT